MRVGLIARADNGGLGSLTWEFARHIQPHRVVVMDLEADGRSTAKPERYSSFQTYICKGRHLSDDAANWLLSDVDIVYTAETAYRDDFFAIAREAGVKTVVHVMPELFRPCCAQADAIWLPTQWEAHRFDKIGVRYEIVPIPVATDRLRRRHVSHVRTAYHIGSAAMMDRNGSGIVLKAAKLVRNPCVLKLINVDRPVETPTSGNVQIEILPSTENYWETIPDDADLLLLPRRYAGASLPMQEALASGIPVLSTRLEPQQSWPGVVGVPVVGRARRVRMAGGVFEIHSTAPALFAREWDRLISDPKTVTELSRQASEFGDWLSWDIWKERYTRRFVRLLETR